MVISNGEINIIGEMEGTGGVRLNNNRQKLRTRFDIVRKLGQGTYGKVQLAVNKDTGEEVAIKTIKKAKIESEQDLVRIQREIQIMSSVQHPHIIHIYEVFENKEKIVLVMEYANGGELYDYLSYKKVLGECEARRLFRQIVSAVYYCHKNKICHRDLKLENILLDQRGNAKIADFGLSNVFDEKRMLTTFCGSPLYASPEIVKGTPYYGPEVDCWSLGVLLYTLVYGAMPFDGSNFRRLVKQISEGDYYEPKKPSEASALIRRMLTVIPAKRATVEDICIDWWVNQGYQEALQDVSEEMCQAMPVRLDYLLSLATQKTPAENAESKPEETKASKPIDSETNQLTDNTVICQSVPTETENLNIQGELSVPSTLPGEIDLLSTEQADTDKIPQLMEIQQPEDASQISTRKHKLSVSEKSLVTDSAERIGSIKKKKRKEELHEEKTKLKDNKSNVIEENKTINLPLDANKLPDDKIVSEEISSASQMNNDQAIVENKTIVPFEHDSSAAEPPIDKISSELCNKTTDSNAKDNQNVVDSVSNDKPIDVLQNNEKAVPTTTSVISDKKKLTDLPPSSSQVGRKSSFGLPDTSKKEGAGPNSRKTSLTNAANFKQITDSITSNRKGSVGPSDSSKLTGIMSMFGGRKGSIGSGDTGKLPPFAGPSSRKNSVTADSRLEKPGNNTVESNKDTVKAAQSDIKNNKSIHENSVDCKDENKTNNTILSESEKPLSFKRRDSVKDNADNAKGTNSISSSIDVGNKSLSPKSSVLDKQRKSSITGEAKDTVSKNIVVAGRRQSLPVPKVDKMEVDESSSGTDTNKSEDEEKKMNLTRKESISHSEDSSSGSPHGLSPTSSKLEPRHMQEKKENKKKVAVPQAFSKVSEARKAFEAKPPEKRSLVIPGMKVSAARKAFETTQPDKSSKLPKPKTDLFNRRSSAADTGKLLDNEAMSPMKIAAKRLSVAQLEQSPLPSKFLNGNEVSEIKEASTIPFNQSEKNDKLNGEKIESIPQSEMQLVNTGAENKENSSNETSFALSSEMITKSSDLEKAGKVLAIDSSQKMTGFVPTLDVTMEVKPVSKEPFSKLSSATKSIAKSAAEDTSLNFTASVIPPETENDNDDLSHRISQSAIENSLHSTESSIASTSVTSKLTTNESKSSLEVTGDEYSPFSSASTLVPNFPSPSPSVTSLCSVPSPVPPVSEVKNMPSKDICGSETSFLARAFMHQHEKGSVSPPVGKNSPTPALREQPASPVTKDKPVLILIKDPPAPSQSEAESPKTKGTKISSVEIKLNTSESSTGNKASKNIEKPLQQIVPESQPNIQHKSPGAFTLLGVKSEVSFNVEAAPPMDEPPSTVTTSYYSMPPLAPNAKSAKPPVIKSSEDKSAALPKSSKKNITTIPTTPPPTPPPVTTSLPSTVLKLHDQTTEISKVEEMAKPVQNKSPPSNHPESENTLVTAYSPVSSEIMTKKPRERLIPIQLEDSSNLTSVQKPIEEKNPTDKKSFRSSRLRSGSEGLYERGTSFSSDSGPGSPVDSIPNERGSQKSDDEQRGYGVYRSKFRSIHKAFLSDERRESSLEKSESFSSTGSTDDLEDIFDSFASENLLSNLLNRTRTIIDQLTNDDSTRRFGSVFSRMPLMGTSLSGFRSSFGRTDPFSRRDPFGRSEPSTSFRSDPFGKSDSFGKADSFRKSDSFGSYCGGDSGLGSSRFSRSTSRQNSEPTNNSSFSSRNSWRSSRSQYPEKSEADNYMSDSGTGSTRKSRDSSTYSRTSSRDDESALSDNCSTRSSFSSARRSLFNYSRSVSTSISEEDVQSSTSTSNQTGSTRRFSERSSSREEGSTTSRFSRSRDSSITREGGSSRRDSSLSQFARLSSRFHSDDFFGGSRDCLDSDFQDEFMSGINDRRSYNRSLSSEYSRDNGIGSMRRRHSLRSLFDMANEKNSEKAEEVLVQRQEETRRRESQSRFLNRRSMRYDADDISIYGTIRRQPGHYLNYSKSLSKEISGRDSDEEILGIHRPRSILVLTDPDAEDASATDNEDSSSATDVSRGRYDSYDDSSRRGGGSAGGGGGGGGNSGDGGGGGNGERSSRSSYGGSRSFRQNSHGSSYGKGNKESDVSENRNVKASQFTENSSQLNNNNYASELKPKAASDNEHVHDVLAGISIETSNDNSHSDNSQISDDVGKKTSNQSCESKSINQTTSPSNNLKQEVPSKLNVKQEKLNTKKNHLLYHQSGTKNSNTSSQTKKATNSPRNSLYDSYQMNKTPSDTNQIETDNPSPSSEQVVNSSVSMDKENSKSKHDQTIKTETCNSNGKPRKPSYNENQKSNNNLEANNETSKAKKYDEKWVGSVGKASGNSRFKNRRFGTNKELSKSEDALNKVGESDKDEILENKLSKDHDKANSSRIPRNILKFTRSISSELDRLQEDLNAVGSKVSQTKKYRNSVSVDESNTHKSRNLLNSQNVDEVVQELKKLEEDILNLSTNTYQKDSLLKTVDSKTADVKQKEENNSLNITALKKNLLQKSSPSTPRNGNNSTDNLSILSDGYDSANPSDFEDSSSVCSDYGGALEEESVSERIRRKSYFARFQDNRHSRKSRKSLDLDGSKLYLNHKRHDDYLSSSGVTPRSNLSSTSFRHEDNTPTIRPRRSCSRTRENSLDDPLMTSSLGRRTSFGSRSHLNSSREILMNGDLHSEKPKAYTRSKSLVADSDVDSDCDRPASRASQMLEEALEGLDGMSVLSNVTSPTSFSKPYSRTHSLPDTETENQPYKSYLRQCSARSDSPTRSCYSSGTPNPTPHQSRLSYNDEMNSSPVLGWSGYEHRRLRPSSFAVTNNSSTPTPSTVRTRHDYLLNRHLGGYEEPVMERPFSPPSSRLPSVFDSQRSSDLRRYSAILDSSSPREVLRKALDICNSSQY